MSPELHRAIGNAGVLRHQPDFRNGFHQVGFQMQDLETIRRDPCPPLQIDRVVVLVHHVRAQAAGLIVELAEMHQPRCLSLPVAQSLALPIKVVAEQRVKRDR